MIPNNADIGSNYDAIIVGARCAGAATAMLLARAGVKVLLVDWGQRGEDVMSTHALMRGAVMQLSSWGLLDQITAAETPPVLKTEFVYGDDEFIVDIKPSHGVEALYAPRRYLLDEILVRAAENHGAEVRYGVGFRDVKRDRSGRVTGAVLQLQDGSTVSVAADIVIGADGRRSTVARRVGAANLRVSDHATACVYAYFSGLDCSGYRWSYRENLAAGSIPTNGDEHCVFASIPRDVYLNSVRGRLSDALLDYVAATDPQTGLALKSCEMQGSATGYVGQKGHIRQSYGRGWALVGDAGYFKDPLTAHGITDALRDSEILANAYLMNGGLGLEVYQSQRDSLSGDMFNITDRVASWQWDLQELMDLHKKLNQTMKAEQDWMDAKFNRGELALVA